MTFWFLFILTVFLCLGEFNIGGHWNRSLMQGVGICIIVLVSVLRFDVGFDYMSYYQDISGNTYDRYEPICWLIFHFAYIIKYPPIAFMLIACLTYSFVFPTIRKFSVNSFVGIMIYVCMFYLISLNTMRQSLAIAIVFWGVRYILQRSLFKYVLTCVFASLFHSSAIVSILFYPLYRFVSAKYLPMVILIIAMGYRLVLELFLNMNFYAGFSDAVLELSEEDANLGGGSYTRYAMVVIVVFIYFLAWMKKADVDYRLLSFPTMGCLFPFILGSHIGSRVSEYFCIYLCLVIPQVLNAYNVRFRTMIVGAFMCYFLLFIAAGRNQKRPSFLPYQTVFNIQNIEKPLFRNP